LRVVALDEGVGGVVSRESHEIENVT